MKDDTLLEFRSKASFSAREYVDNGPWFSNQRVQKHEAFMAGAKWGLEQALLSAEQAGVRKGLETAMKIADRVWKRSPHDFEQLRLSHGCLAVRDAILAHEMSLEKE